MDKRERIFQATRHLLAEQGFHGISMAQVAKAAGIATGTIYLYFKDKADLLQQLNLFLQQRAQKRLLAQINAEMPLSEQYRTIWLNLYQLLSEDPDSLRCRAQYQAAPNYLEMEQDPSIAMIWQPLNELFMQGVARGELLNLPIPILKSLSLGTISPIVTECRRYQIALNDTELDTLLLASWRAIKNPGYQESEQ